MRRLDIYIVTTVSQSLLLTLLVLLSLACLIEWMDQRSATTGVVAALEFAVLTLPRRAHELLPYVGLLGVLAGLGALAATHELTAARSVGHSVARIVGMALLPVLVLLLASVVLSEWLMPKAESRIAMQRALRSGGDAPAGSAHAPATAAAAAELGPLRWLRVVDRGREEFIAVSAFDERGQMYGVTGFSFSTGALAAVWQAQQIDPAHGASMVRIRRDWAVTEFSGVPGQLHARAGAGITRGHAERQNIWRVPVHARDFEQRSLRDAERMTVAQLHALIRVASTRVATPLSRLFESVFWQRLAQPFEALLLAALGAGFVFGSLRVSSVGVRLAVGVLVAIVFKYLGDLITLLMLLTAWPAWWTALLPLLLLAALAYASLMRSR